MSTSTSRILPALTKTTCGINDEFRVQSPSPLSQSMSWDGKSDASLWDVREFVSDYANRIKLEKKYTALKTARLDFERLMDLPIWEPPISAPRAFSQEPGVPLFEPESEEMTATEEESEMPGFEDSNREYSATDLYSSIEDGPLDSKRGTKKLKTDAGSRTPRKERQKTSGQRPDDTITPERAIGATSPDFGVLGGPPRNHPSSLYKRLIELAEPLASTGRCVPERRSLKEMAEDATEARELAGQWLTSTRQRLLGLALMRTSLLVFSDQFSRLRNEMFPTHSAYWIERHAGTQWGLFDSRPNFIIRQSPEYLRDSPPIRRYYTFLSNSPSLSTSHRFALSRMLHPNCVSHGSIVSANVHDLSIDQRNVKSDLVSSFSPINGDRQHRSKFKSFIPSLPSPRILDLDLLSRLTSLSAQGTEELQSLLSMALDKPTSMSRTPVVADVREYQFDQICRAISDSHSFDRF